MNNQLNQKKNQFLLFFRTLLSILMVLLIFFLLTTALLSLIYNQIISDKQLQKYLLQEANYSSVIKPLLISKMLESFASQQSGSAHLFSSPATQKKLAEALLSDSWVERFTIDSLNSFIKWLHDGSENDLPKLTIDLSSIRQNLLSSQGKLAVLSLIQKFPICEQQDANAIPSPMLSQCLPAETDLNKLAADTVLSLASMIPNEMTIEFSQLIPRNLLLVFQQIRSTIQLVFLAAVAYLILTLLILVITAILYRAELRKFFIILSLPFYLSSIPFIVIYGFWQISSSDYYRWTSGLHFSQDEAINNCIITLVKELITFITTQSFIYSLGILAFGILLSLISIAVKPKVTQPENRKFTGRIRQQYR